MFNKIDDYADHYLDNKKILQYLKIISNIVMIIVWVSFVLTPMTGDLKVFMASANQSNYISKNLIVGSFKAWELKSVFSRLLMYFIYKISVLFTSYNTYAFEIMSKLIYSIFIIIISYISMKLIFVEEHKRVSIYSRITIISFMAMHIGCQMQVEMTVSLLILLAFSLYINAIITGKNQSSKLLGAGMLIGSTFFFKSVLLLLSVTVVAAIAIFEIQNGIAYRMKRLLLVILGSCLMLFITTIFILFINPVEFQDMLDASAFQNTLLSSSLSIRNIICKFSYNHLMRIGFVPIVIVGVVSFLFNLCSNIYSKRWNLVLMHLIMWIMPAIFIVLSNKYFVYHFVVYIFPSLIEVYYAVLLKKKFVKHVLFVISAVIFGWYLIFFSIISNNVRSYISYDLQTNRKTEEFLREISFDRNQKILYLDDGRGGYYLGNPSYLKYFFPLPLQRLEEDSNLKCHIDSVNMAMKFEGKYISVYEEWFFKYGKYQNLKEKIMNEYEYVGNYFVFSPPHSYLESDIEVKAYKLYERK